jgi:hypothetical protein
MQGQLYAHTFIRKREFRNRDRELTKNDKDSLVIPRIAPLEIPNDIHIGIDKERFNFPINTELSMPLDEGWVPKNGTPLLDGTPTYYHVKKFPLGLHKMTAILWETSSSCTVDFNPAHSLYGNNELLLPPRANTRMIQAAIEATGLIPGFAQIDHEGTVTWPRDWYDHVSPTSVELARNCFIKPEYKHVLQDALSALVAPRGYLKDVQSIRDSYSLYYKTATVGHDKIYDKTVQMRDDKQMQQVTETDNHIFRFETTLASKRLDKYGLRDLRNFNDETVWKALTHRFSECRWEVRLPSRNDLMQELAIAPYAEAERLLGFNQMVSIGLDKSLGYGARRDRQKLAQKYGVVPGTALSLNAIESNRLDLFLGRLVEDAPS